MKDEFISRVGLCGQRHYNFLKKNNPTVINVMRLNGTLEQYLNDLDRNAQEMFELMTKQYAELEGITEELKAENQVEWVSQMNSIKARVINIVNAELIYI
ncbi:MAG: TnpV protein [Pseudoruminococcus massiliensis]|uniref:TnpV protein n=1 Tax=Pseudoruminococcus massiliensis TaxID=2086583 RepID=UPI003996161A|nr:TnpV protein [Oscillospiraceae bacterium]